MPVARPESSDSRVIAHVDLDCFYVQVEQRRRPELRGRPAAVVQYNSWKGGGLIAVGYEARKYGVKRSMRGDEAKRVCPEIHLVQVPVARGKADLNVYRNAGSEVVSVLAGKGRCERASIDEVYLDLTEAAEKMLDESPPENLGTLSEEALRSHILGIESNEPDARDKVKQWLLGADAERRDKLLACGALIVAELRLQVLQETEFTCSAGIAHNKMLAKLASGMNKPAQQTVVPFSSVKQLLEDLPIKKMKQLGGKLGTSLQVDLGVNTVGDLLQFSEAKLQELYGVNTGTWLWNISRGISGEEVEGRILPKSHGAGKTFPGPRALKTIAAVEKWLNDLCEELSERLLADLEKNKRIAHTLTLHASAYNLNDEESFKKFPSKSCPLRYGIAKIQHDALNLFKAGLREYLGIYNVKSTGPPDDDWGVTGLSVSASKIVAVPPGTRSIFNYFCNLDQTTIPGEVLSEKSLQDEAPSVSPGRGTCSEPYSDECIVELPDETEKISSVLPLSDFEEHEKERISRDKEDNFVTASGEHDHYSASALSDCQNGKELRDNIAHSVKSKDQKRKNFAEKGASSILKFFQTRIPSSPLKEQADILQETAASSSCSMPRVNSNSNTGSRKHNRALVMDGTEMDTVNFNQNEARNSEWTYKIDEIDRAVLNELPKEIQDEVNAWVRPQKRANTVKKCCTISNFFSPTKKDM